MQRQREKFRKVLVDALRPALRRPVSEWVDEHFVLSREYSSQPGKMRCWAFQREPMDCCGSAHPARKIIIMGASQMLKSQAIMAMFAYAIHMDPGPCMYVAPREADVTAFSKERIAPMIRDIPVLAERVSQAKSRDSKNTIEQKTFFGGHINFLGGQVPENAMARSNRYMAIDEADRLPRQLGNEGDTLSLFEARQTNYYFNSKLLIASSPTIKGLSLIDREYELSDQRDWKVPCPHCGHKQRLVWDRIKWADQDPSIVWYECKSCEQPIEERHKLVMIEAGEWVKANPASDIPGFRISQLYSMIKPWRALVAQYLKVKHDPIDLKAFTNTVLNELWIESGEAPDWQIVKSKSEAYRLTDVHPRVMFLTAGVDVQDDRLEVFVAGWSRRREMWLVDYRTLDGKTDSQAVWDELALLMMNTYKHPSGLDLEIRRMAVDSGYRTAEVYTWARNQAPGRIIVVKGAEFGAGIIGQPLAVDVKNGGKKMRRGLKVVQVNVSHLKSELYGALRLAEPPEGQPSPGYVHLPEMTDEWFQQLTAEELVRTTSSRGYDKFLWKKVRARNEALDTAVYARAAHASLGADSWPEARWEQLESELTVRQYSLALLPEVPQEKQDVAPVVMPQVPAVVVAQASPSAWMGRRGGNWFNR
jgi:phage terminase large subunit GpA-like protein